MLQDRVHSLAESSFKEVREIRRHLHKYPELSFNESKTAAYIQGKLDELGIAYTRDVAGHGTVVNLIGKEPGKPIALRADIDALPINETNQVDYRSQNPGIMHACGHDVHTASLLGAIKIIHRLEGDFKGSIRCIFQPAEEKLPGGASLMIKEGVLTNPVPDHIFGQHVHPPLSVGKVGFRSGMYMASCDEIYITVKGRGAHGALPQDGVDPVVIASQLVLTLQQLVSRKADPTIPTVLTFGKMFTDGGAPNVIPDQIHLEGTFRTMNEEWRREAHSWLTRMVHETCNSLGGQAELEIRKGYPYLINDESTTALARQAAVDYLGEDNVVDLPIRMTAEDFSYYSQVVPACFYRLGTGNVERNIVSPVHTSTFDVDEDCLQLGCGLMAYIALKALGN